MEKHARFSPSKLSMILTCPASASYDGPPLPSNKYADEGTLLHNCVEQCLSSLSKFPDVWSAFENLEGLTPEQRRAVEDCLLYAEELMEATKHEEMGVFYDIETRVFVYPDCHGTLDFCVYNYDVLHIVDWKFGAGIEVSAVENKQLLAYAAGKMVEISTKPDKVVLHVVQPRLGNFSTYELSKNDLYRWSEFELMPGLKAAASPNPKFNPTEEACRWCPRKVSCTARLQLAMSNAEQVFAEHAKMPDIPLEALQKLLPMAKQIEQVIKDLTAYGQLKLMHGEQVPGYKLVYGRSNRAWADEKAAAHFLAEQLEPEEMYDVKLITPAKAEDKLPREFKKDDRFQCLITKPEGKITMVPEDDKRPPIAISAETAFEDYAEAANDE